MARGLAPINDISTILETAREILSDAFARNYGRRSIRKRN